MVAYHYDFRIALVKGSPNVVAANATVLVYDPLDAGMATPVTVYSNPGLTTIINLVTDTHGVVPDFWSDRPDLLWKSGTYSGGWATTSSRPGLRGPSGSAGPAGPAGPQGAPGINGAGTNAEVAAFIPATGPTRDALDARFLKSDTELPEIVIPARLGEAELNATFATPAAVSAAVADTGYDVLLLAGQSNMSGRGIPSTTYLDPAHPSVFQLKGKAPNKGTVIAAADPLDMVDTPSGIGPGFQFARQYIKAGHLSYGRKLLLVPTAEGGTPLTRVATPTWKPSVTGSLYSNMITQATTALALPGARLVAVLWV